MKYEHNKQNKHANSAVYLSHIIHTKNVQMLYDGEYNKAKNIYQLTYAENSDK